MLGLNVVGRSDKTGREPSVKPQTLLHLGAFVDGVWCVGEDVYVYSHFIFVLLDLDWETLPGSPRA